MGLWFVNAIICVACMYCELMIDRSHLALKVKGICLSQLKIVIGSSQGDSDSETRP